nr:PREDICTED: F-box/LRR-repeat protein At3g48880-like isoform X3 [Musa acuminata subsp. malaccensis]
MRPSNASLQVDRSENINPNWHENVLIQSGEFEIEPICAYNPINPKQSESPRPTLNEDSPDMEGGRRCWRRASLDPGCWRRLDFRSLDLMPWSHFSRSFTSCDRLSSLSFSAFMRFVVARSRGSAAELLFPLSFGASIQDLTFVSMKCPRLKRLALPDNFMLEDDLLIPELVGRWRDLEQLEMETKPSSFLEMIAVIGRNCSRFGRLKVRGLIGKEDAKAIVDCLPDLNHLELSKSYLTKEELVVIVNGCRKLERLTVKDCLGLQVDDEVVRSASRIKCFEHEGSKLLDDYGYETDESEQQSGIFYW